MGHIHYAYLQWVFSYTHHTGFQNLNSSFFRFPWFGDQDGQCGRLSRQVHPLPCISHVRRGTAINERLKYTFNSQKETDRDRNRQKKTERTERGRKRRKESERNRRDKGTQREREREIKTINTIAYCSSKVLHLHFSQVREEVACPSPQMRCCVERGGPGPRPTSANTANKENRDEVKTCVLF